MNATDLGANRHRGMPLLPVDPDERWDDEFDAETDGKPALDLHAVWGAILRNRWIIAAIIAVSLLAGLGATMLAVPRYRANASIQIDQRVSKVLGTEDEDSYSSAADTDRYLQTQVDILKSRALAKRVADDLNLYENKHFLDAIGFEPTPEVPPETLRRSVIGALQDSLSIALPRNSRVVTISYASRSPQVSADVANAVTRNFIESSLQRRFDQSAYARNFLSEQLAQAKARLEQSELAAISYARSARLIDTSDAASGEQTIGPRSLTTSDLVQLNQAYAQAQATRLQAEERWEQARSTPLASLPEVLANPAVQELSRKRAELEADYQQDRERHKEDYPTVRQARASLTAIDQQIGAIGASILGSIRANYDVALKQERAFAGRIEGLKSDTLSEQDRSVRYNILKREGDTNRQLYDALLQRFREVSAASGATNNNIAVIDTAEPPTRPFSPRPMLNLALAGLVGLALSAAFVFIRERFDDAIREPADMERKLGLPLLGLLPRVSTGDPLIELDNPKSALSEANQALRTSLELSSSGGMPRSVLLTSSRQSEGKSTTSLSIARTLANAGRRVLLVDADLRKPSLHRYLDVRNEAGLSTLLAGQATLDAVVKTTTTPNLALVSSGPLPPDPAQLLASERLVEFLHAALAGYDHVVLDGPPVLGLADAPRLASIVSGVIFVVEAGRAHRGGAKAALRRLVDVHAKLTGAVLTKFDSHGRGYGYAGYGYYEYGTEK